MKNTLRFLSAMLGLIVFSTVCMAQTRADFERDYGRPKTGGYLIKPGLILEADFDNDGQALSLDVSSDIENRFGTGGTKFIERNTALEISENLTAERRKGTFVRKITFSAGCTSIEYYHYENVGFNYVLQCQPDGDSRIVRVQIRWREQK